VNFVLAKRYFKDAKGLHAAQNSSGVGRFLFVLASDVTAM
jgi:hypothetical protein